MSRLRKLKIEAIKEANLRVLDEQVKVNATTAMGRGVAFVGPGDESNPHQLWKRKEGTSGDFWTVRISEEVCEVGNRECVKTVMEKNLDSNIEDFEIQ